MSNTENKFPQSLKDAMRQMMRNNRWGTCVSCPRDSEYNVYPEFCEHTDRADHYLTMRQLAEQYAICVEK